MKSIWLWSYHLNGDIITVPTDAALEATIKNFSVVAWIKSSVKGSTYHVVAKGTGNNIWSMQVRGLLD